MVSECAWGAQWPLLQQMNIGQPLSGDDWQKWADRLLSARYGPGDYQRVPDRHRGDAGIEGFVLSLGHAYQAYGPEEPLSIDARYEKHRDKMTRDTKKFIENRDILRPIFGAISISRWILFVPVFDSRDLVAHATKRTSEIQAALLPYVTSDFRVAIVSETDFEAERDAVLKSTAITIDVLPREADASAVQNWQAESASLLVTMNRKLAKIHGINSANAANIVIRKLLEGQNLLDDYRRFPETRRTVQAIKRRKENFLEAESTFSEKKPRELLNHVRRDIEIALREEIPQMSPANATALAWEAVADWLARCPLDFPEDDHGSV
jgi:hypothetical protein